MEMLLSNVVSRRRATLFPIYMKSREAHSLPPQALTMGEDEAPEVWAPQRQFFPQRPFLPLRPTSCSSANKICTPGAVLGALTSARRAAMLSATGYTLFAPGCVFAQRHHQLARVSAAAATLFPVYMKSREAHFLAAAGRRGGCLKFGRRSDNLRSPSFPSLSPLLHEFQLQNPHFRRRARRSLPPGRCFRQNLPPSVSRAATF
jgi:hypothetical protein